MQAKTYEEHLEYLYEAVKLQLCFSWHWQHAHPDEDYVDVLRNRIDVYRKLDLNAENLNPRTCNWDDPLWLQLEADVCALYEKHTDDVHSFEQSAFDIFKEQIRARSQRDYEEPTVLDGYQCGSLKYDKPGEDTPGRVFFHIANAMSPRSIFEIPEYLPHCLLELMQKSHKEYGATELRTQTWLNSYPAWQKLFPQSWQDNMQDELTDVLWHFGFWGQFINARGCFNYKFAKQLRATGKLPYYPRDSWCSFDDLLDHLETHFGI